MGNRATVIFTDGKNAYSPAVYLHWNGGPESVYGFLAELERRQVRADQDYEAARFVQLVGEFFDQDKQGSLSLGISNGPKPVGPAGLLKALAHVQTDHGDNGFYLVNRIAKPMAVRRFVETADTLRELDADEVATERRMAEAHKYAADFRETYETIGAGRPVEGR